jgi:chemotaxis signal transduction protein
MSEHEDTGAGAAAQPPSNTPDETRELLLMRAGGHAFAVYADETDGEAQHGPKPTPLPDAPRAVLGVVCVRGRMRTVLDPLALVNAQGERDAARDDETPRLFVTLRGDEQLALAVEQVGGTVRVPAGAFAPSLRPAPPLRATLEHEGAHVLVLDPSRLFDAAMQGTERRRQRT